MPWREQNDGDDRGQTAVDNDRAGVSEHDANAGTPGQRTQLGKDEGMTWREGRGKARWGGGKSENSVKGGEYGK